MGKPREGRGREVNEQQRQTERTEGHHTVTELLPPQPPTLAADMLILTPKG